jgi:hypothetical protein
MDGRRTRCDGQDHPRHCAVFAAKPQGSEAINITPGMNVINELTGPAVFDAVDRQLRENVRRHHEMEGKSGQKRLDDPGNNSGSVGLIGHAGFA